MRKRLHLPVTVAGLLLTAAALTGHPSSTAAAAERPATSSSAFLTENVRSNPTMPQPHVLHDVHAGVSLGDVVLWQEIAPARYKAALAGLPDNWRTVQSGTEDPISYDARHWALVSSDRALLSRGRAHVTPQRWATWAVLSNRDTGRVLAFMDTHYVSGAWTSRPVSYQAWRQRVWRQEWDRQDAVVDQLAERGLTIMGGGDFNRVRLPHFSPRQTDLNQGSIDHLWVVPGTSADVEPGRSWRYDHLYSDHDAVVAPFDVG